MTITKEQIEIIKDNLYATWHTKRGLGLFISIVIIGLLFLFDGVDLKRINGYEPLVMSFVLIGSVLFWFGTRIKKASKGKVGIGVAIAYEEDEESRKLHRDFIISIRNALKGAELDHKFELIEYSNYVSKKVISYSDANDLARLGGLSFLLYGQTRLRNSNSGSIHIIDLNGLVKHAPIEQKVSREFGEEFSRVLRGFKMKVEENVAACDFAANHISVVTKYIIGIAATFSQNFTYSEQLLIDAEKILEDRKTSKSLDNLSKDMLERVKQQIIELYSFWISMKSQQYAFSRDPNLLKEMDGLVEKLRRYQPEDDHSSHVAAICAFKLRRDIEEVQNILLSCRDMKDPVWLYNQAFIFAYKDELDEAYRYYSKAFGLPLVDKTIPLQCEQFMQEILDDEPDKVSLYFCLGLINFKAKEDYSSAKIDFLRFLERSDKAIFPKQFAAVEQWLEEIEASTFSKASNA